MENENSLGGVQININKNTAIIVIKRLYTNVTVPFCDLLNTDTISEFLIKGVSFKYLHFQENKKKKKEKRNSKKTDNAAFICSSSIFSEIAGHNLHFCKKDVNYSRSRCPKGF